MNGEVSNPVNSLVLSLQSNGNYNAFPERRLKTIFYRMGRFCNTLNIKKNFLQKVLKTYEVDKKLTF